MTLAIGFGQDYSLAPALDHGLSDDARKVRRLAWQPGGLTTSITFDESKMCTY